MELIEHFNLMVDPSSVSHVNGEVVQLCAFRLVPVLALTQHNLGHSFPAVCWAVGPLRWDWVSETYRTLAANDDVRSRCSSTPALLSDTLLSGKFGPP